MSGGQMLVLVLVLAGFLLLAGTTWVRPPDRPMGPDAEELASRARIRAELERQEQSRLKHPSTWSDDDL